MTLLRPLAVAVVLAACGTSTVAVPAWRISHPDADLVTFVDNPEAGLCAFAAKDADRVPAVIRAAGVSYVEVGVATPSGSGAVLVHSGDWTLIQPDPATLMLTTPSQSFSYRKTTC